MSNVQVMAKAKIFNTPVDAVYVQEVTKGVDKKMDGNEYKFDLTKKTMLVHGCPDVPVELTLQEIISELSLGSIKPEDILSHLPQSAQTALEDTKFSIREIYYTKETASFKNNNDATGSDINKDKDKSSGNKELKKYTSGLTQDSAYAIWIETNITGDWMKDFPIEIDRLSFKIWNTNNTVIIEEMEVDKIKKILDGAGISTDSSIES